MPERTVLVPLAGCIPLGGGGTSALTDPLTGVTKGLTGKLPLVGGGTTGGTSGGTSGGSGGVLGGVLGNGTSYRARTRTTRGCMLAGAAA